MELKLLHLSDIHFQHFGKNEHLDNDDDIRNELEFDLEEIVKNYGAINAILIGGDITFSAKENEYIKAADWIKKVCKLCDCEEENVLTVPGNHDIDWDSIGNMLNTTHEKFKSFRNRLAIDEELHKYLSNDNDLNALLSPLENYYNFAQKYNAVPHQNRLYWEKDLFVDNIKLRIRGMNSAIISNKKDEEHNSKLVLGSHQTILKREKGMIYLTLCHHPTQWLYDGDDAEADIVARARIQLYGHKHIFKITKLNNSLRLSAGALHPSRTESGWEPRFNVIGISIFEKELKRFLRVCIWERVWNDRDKKFTPKYFLGGLEYTEYLLELDEFESQQIMKEEKKMETNKLNEKQVDVEQINLAQPNPKRKLAYLFFDLPFHIRIKIASMLNLIEDTDASLSATQQSQNFLMKAIDQNKLKHLWEQVAKHKTELNNIINPFN